MRIRAFIAAVIVIVCAVVTAAATATATTALPRVPGGLDITGSQLRVRPSEIIYTGDGTGLISGPTFHHGSSIAWSHWNTTTALGTGFDQLDNCRPSCAGGTFTAYPVQLELWRPRTLSGAFVFTRMTMLFTGKIPPGTGSGTTPHYTFTDVDSRARFGWGPPDASGYCVNRHGEAAFAGCANIHVLPPAGLF